jgi:type I restriction enzyme M protein
MAEHLTPTGRAGIIVPEGVIFQSQTAYKDLRKMLVENALVAVVSLPAGCFNPYSGVKTSILILDKPLARKSNTIAFFKVENDGFGLGAQRRAIEKNDLPQVKAELEAYLQALRSQESTGHLQPTCGLIVPKEKIAANGDYNLSGERYREGTSRASHFPTVPLGDVCELIGGGTPSKQVESYWQNGSVKWISSKHIGEGGSITGYELISKKAVEETSTRIAPQNSTIVITRVSVGKFAFADDDYAINQDLTALVSKDSERLAPEFIRVVAPHIAGVVERNAEGIGVRGVTRSFLSELQIPLPPLEVQKEIVAQIEGYQKVINGARAVLDHYRPHIPIHPDWPMVPLGDIADVKLGKMLDQAKHDKGQMLPYARNVSVRWGSIDTHDLPEMYFEEDELERFGLRAGDVLVCEGGEPGRAAVWDGRIPNLKYQKALHRVRFKVPFEPSVLVFLLQEMALSGALVGWLSGTTIKHLTLESFNKLPIPLPPLATQQTIVAEVEAEQSLVAANCELITRFEQKIQTTLARVWGQEAPAATEA